MVKTGDKLNRDIERGLKAIAEERVAVPSNFRSKILRELAAQTGQDLPRSAQPGLWERLAALLAPRVLVPAAAAAAVLALWFSPSDPAQVKQPEVVAQQPAPVEKNSPAPASVNAPVEKALVASSSSNDNAAEAPVAVNAAPKEKTVLSSGDGLLPMPRRLPNSLAPLQKGKLPATAPSPSKEEARAVAASEPIRIIVTPEPTPMTHGLSGFSEVRNNVFKPGQGEYAAILFQLDEPDHVTVEIFDINGRLVARLIEENRSPGLHELRWSGYNGNGEIAGSGKYVVVIHARDGRQVARHKVALLR